MEIIKMGFWVLSIMVIILSVLSLNLHTNLQTSINETRSIIKDCNETVNFLSDFIDEQHQTILNLSIQNENLSLELENTKQKLNNKIRQKKFFENNFNQINKIYENMKTQKGLINPTYSELINFVDRDDTDKLEYDEDSFDCTEFSYRFISNFAKKGYYSCTTEINFFESDSGHHIVTVNTTDKGLVYVEPQTDDVFFKLKIGSNYCSERDWNCDWDSNIVKISNCFELKI